MFTSLIDELTDEQAPDGILHLFGGPYFRHQGRRFDVPEGSKRLLVLVALRKGRLSRRAVAGALWPVGEDERAAGNLRSALWRLNKAGIDIIDADKNCLSLREGVAIDVSLVTSWAGRLIVGNPTPADLSVLPESVDSLDLLPGWYDDWISLERESVRQSVLHGLEALVCQLIVRERFAEAVTASMMAVTADPLRETAQRSLMQAHLAEGNLAEAYKAYQCYRRRLWDELQIHPGQELRGLLGRAVTGAVATPTYVPAPSGLGHQPHVSVPESHQPLPRPVAQ
ncbi:DNA-binding transcriptional activator of the SARP family [Actinopolymorpha cephalotaxi]|uniref:DNA-binding SARP family transcriptional activator n=1 Tax=Actinopolymorpha cephalotaxi TaxID=504797 RepID=A0A1I3BR69_9ACTN|nr:BTAD domain-containing putative transcriptional regulator [Actinopolymorpha cephalotaxi]NYH83767.1 DNA-binding SARP family transcriptional activator [Actinopolymorpha cephalotaxi]SFH64808.1 DNA-binding transcriptional activator of the SARP family [Actinopolymorpha cephalotaxi]